MSPSPIYRRDFKSLSKTRLEEGRILLDAGYWGGAFYLTGYAIECALKACVARSIGIYQFPDKRKAEAAWRHDLKVLVGAAELEAELRKAEEADSVFAGYWAWVSGPTGWSEQSRYRPSTLEGEARDLYAAVTDPAHGILRWIHSHW